MENKIIQIMPAPANLFCICRWCDSNGNVRDTKERVVCFALTESDEGGRYVEPMIFDEYMIFPDHIIKLIYE